VKKLEQNWKGTFAGLKEDWSVIEKVLPTGWLEAAQMTGAWRRRPRGIDDPIKLLRILLIHLADGCSLRETAVRARAGNLAAVSDVALLKRLRNCGEWFRWMAEQMTQTLSSTSACVLPGKRVRLVDASVICEPGATGSTWRLHYMIDLSTLRCEQAQVTLPNEGETLTRFTVQPGDVLMADRGLAHRRGIRYVKDHGGDVVVRMNLVGVPLEDKQGQPFDVLSAVRTLVAGEVGNWQAWIRDERGTLPVRVCALRKTEAQTLKSQEKLRKTAARKNRQLQPETLEVAGFVLVLTTLVDTDAEDVMELYRYRWQIELAFKRLKSLLQLGHLKKTDPEGAKAWLQGKLFVATLIEMLIAVGERFSPWGYFCHATSRAPLPLAGMGVDALFVGPGG
jgi:hypothetical protein